GEMLLAGLPVPDGFVILTDAYRSFVEENCLLSTMTPLSSYPLGQASELDEQLSHIRTRFEHGCMSAKLQAAIVSAYQELGGGAVAVRSSATAEDLPDASFAGQQESFLNIEGVDALMAAVKSCWASLWNARAVTYRSQQLTNSNEVALAVVVQRMVPAEVAGVMFTANPITGRRDQIVIDAARGLGEALVSGAVNPDHWVVDQHSRQVVEQRLATDSKDHSDTPVLKVDQIKQLVEMGLRVADHFGSPQDIEWAWAGGELHVLQSRPITSLYPLPREMQSPTQLKVYVCANLTQGVAEPFTPMGLDIFGEVVRSNGALLGAPLRPGMQAPNVHMAGGRLFVEITEAMRDRRLRKRMDYQFGRVEPQMVAIIDQLSKREPELAPTQRGKRAGMPLKLAVDAVSGMIYGLRKPNEARQQALAICEQTVQRIESESESVASLADGVDFVSRTVRELRDSIIALVPVAGVGWFTEPVLRSLVGKWLDDPSLLDPVLRSMPHNPTTEMDLELWHISRILKSEGAEPHPAHPAVKSFLDRFGHRAIREMDIGLPRWREEPEHVLNVLRTYLAHGDEMDAERHFRAGDEAARVQAERLIALATAKATFKGSMLRWLIKCLRATAGVREYPKFFTIRILAAVRGALLKCGRYLVQSGYLERADDVAWLGLAELRHPSDFRRLVTDRRLDYQREQKRRTAPRVMTSTGEVFLHATTVDIQSSLVGTPASSGIYEGSVRVVHDPKQAVLEPGEILVAPGTDPAWTPLFLSAGALVMEIGGMMSHGSVVAREYGIPAVVGVTGAIHRLQTGMRIRVDGTAGTISVLSK
ncbi:MAG: PEP/pyruvate-binding domain-containing protein, partial [Bacillota bacterium]